MRNGREEIKFIVGDYPQDVRQLICKGQIFGTVDQDPYPQAYNAMKILGCASTERTPRYRSKFPAVAFGSKGKRRRIKAAWGYLHRRINARRSPSSPLCERFKTVSGRTHEIP
jgi:ribose transport system substrate-binding protein